jgi:hypothetical protein
MKTKLPEGVVKKDNTVVISVKGLKQLFTRTVNDANDSYFEDWVMALRNKEFKSVKYQYDKERAVDLTFEMIDDDFWQTENPTLKILDAEKFYSETITWLRKEQACDPEKYFRIYFGPILGIRHEKFEVLFVAYVETPLSLTVYAHNAKEAAQKVKEIIETKKFKKDFSHYTEIPNLATPKDLNGQEKQDVYKGFKFVGKVKKVKR